MSLTVAGCSKNEHCAHCSPAKPGPNVHLAPTPRAPMRLTPQMKPPLLIRRVMPSFPDELKKGSHQPFVAFEATIDARGNVTDVRPIGPADQALLPYVVTAVRQWQFRPATLNDEPVPVIYPITFSFEVR